MNQPPAAYYGAPQRRIRSGRSSGGGFGGLLTAVVVVAALAGAGVYLFVFDGYNQLLDLLGIGPTPSPTRGPTASPVPTVPTPLPTPLPTTARTTDYVQVVFTNPPATTPAVTTAFNNAATRWSNILAGTNINSVVYSGNTFNQFSCGLTNNAAIPDGTTDQLFIAADIAAIDGVGNVLGSAGPCNRFSFSIDRPAVQLPVLGAMTFDSADLANMEAAGTLESVILHEMAHVLGIGTLWDFVQAPDIPESLIVDPIFVDFPTDVRPGNSPKFQGHAAKAEFFVLAASTDDIPVEDGSFASLTPAELNAGQGRGSVDGHWRESEFDTELMTPQIDNFVANPLSIMSIRSLEDLGYAVDPSFADAYTKPATSLGGPGVKHSTHEQTVLVNDIRIPEGLREAWEESRRNAERHVRRLGGGLPKE